MLANALATEWVMASATATATASEMASACKIRNIPPLEPHECVSHLGVGDGVGEGVGDGVGDGVGLQDLQASRTK